MSLLMDALKKAEQEKKEAAKRLKEAQEKSGEHIKLQVEERSATSEKSNQANTQSIEVSNKPDSPSGSEKKSTQELSLAQPDEYTVKNDPETGLSITNPGVEKKESESLFLEDVTIEHTDFSDPIDESDADAEKQTTTRNDKTFALTDLSVEQDSTPPFDDTNDNTRNEKFADTLSGSRTFKSVISAAELARDIGSLGKTAPTPVAAQTVFSAVGGVSGKRKIMEWAAFLGLFAVVLFAAGAFYYLKVTPLTPKVSSPLVAQGVEADVTPAFIVPLPVEEIPEQDMTAPPEMETTASIDPVLENVPGPEQVTTSEPEIADGKTSVAVTTEEPVQDVVEESNVLPEKIRVEEQAIAISRTKSIDKKDQQITAAYAHYNAGNFIQAEGVYQEVLQTMPENRDALLGMAAIAWRKGNIHGAYENYLKVLKLYPRDVVATTGLISLQDNTDPQKNESTIKLMLREQPETSFLYFALGNNYAAQSRWPEAQQAFFEAHRLQSDNPDYAYNLAVSLDHIGQSRTAMDYYNKALELADATQVSFNTANVLARVNDLAKITNQ